MTEKRDEREEETEKDKKGGGREIRGKWRGMREMEIGKAEDQGKGGGKDR